jgi:hypothetical protein
MTLSTRSVKAVQPLGALVLQILFLGSCSGKAEDPNPSTGLPADALLGDLTLEQATVGCERLRMAEARQLDGASTREQCTVLALYVAREEASCAAQRDSCVQTPVENPPRAGSRLLEPSRRLGCDDPVARWRGCAGTVAALETCMDDLLDGLADAVDDFSCRDAPTYRIRCLPPVDPNHAIDTIDPRTGMPPQCELVPVSEACWALQDQCSGLPLQ